MLVEWHSGFILVSFVGYNVKFISDVCVSNYTGKKVLGKKSKSSFKKSGNLL